MRRALGVVVAVALSAACGGGALTTAPVTTTIPGPPGSGTRPVPSSTAPAPTSTAPTAPTPTPPSEAPPVSAGSPEGTVVDLFYAIHVHAQDEWSPFLGPDMIELDPVAADGYINQVEAIAGVLEAHGAVGSFHFTFGTAAGLCNRAPGLFDDLEARGHEIGIHAHSDAFLPMAAEAMVEECGRPIGTGSGLAAMAGGRSGVTRDGLDTSLEVFREVGARQLLVNVSDTCGTAGPGGNDPVPWRTDGGVCDRSSEGILLIDQASLEYVMVGEAPADVFSDVEFSMLADLAEAVIAEAATTREPVVVWGFVTHTNEYVVGASPFASPERTALDGLDLLLTRLDPYVASGRARWSTAAEIAARVP